MLKVVVFSIFVVGQASAETQSLREVRSELSLIGGHLLPGFYDGYLFFINEPNWNHFTLYSPDGKLALDKILQADKHITNLAVDTDGTLAISWGRFEGSADSAIDLLDRNGSDVGSIDTGSYLPRHLVFDAEHALWTFGWQRDRTIPRKPSPEYMAVRKYSRNGHELGTYLSRSLFPHGLEPAHWSWQQKAMAIARDRIGLLACSGMTSAKP